MSSTANEKRPEKFSQYAGQRGAVGYTTSVIKSGAHPSGLLISGMPGTGKTTLAHLYVHATLCEVREEGEYEPCGECDSCKADIEQGGHPNVTYYRITEASSFKEVVSDLITMTKAVPQLTHDNTRDDNHKRFIIIDELQNASRQSISPFLDSLEFASEKVTVVLISMDLDKLDHIVRDAIESRCIELSLDKLTQQTISNTLSSEIQDLHPEASDILAYLSRGNMRRAWSLFDYFKAQMPVMEITAEFISDQKISGLSKDKCLEIVSSLENCTWEDTSNLLLGISNDEEQAVDFFLNMIVNEDLNSNGIDLISACSIWLQCDYKTPILALFRPFQGKNLTGFIETVSSPSVYKKPASEIMLTEAFNKGTAVTKADDSRLHATSDELSKLNNDIANQVSKISNKKVSVLSHRSYTMLAFTEWSQFLKYYANNN